MFAWPAAERDSPEEPLLLPEKRKAPRRAVAPSRESPGTARVAPAHDRASPPTPRPPAHRPCGLRGGGRRHGAVGSNGDNALAESDIATVLDARRRIDAACGSDGSGTPDRTPTEIGDAAQSIASVTAQYPDRVYETGNEDRAERMTDISRRVAEQLERCGIPVEAKRLADVAG